MKNWDLEHFKNIFHLQNESSSEHLNVSSTLSNDAHYTGIFIYTPTLSQQQQQYISILSFKLKVVTLQGKLEDVFTCNNILCFFVLLRDHKILFHLKVDI